jgi:long-chain acyl-CoA synthetase
LVGFAVLERLLRRDREREVFVMTRSPERWERARQRLGALGERVTALRGDVRDPGCGLSPTDSARLANSVTLVVHAAADTVFARPLDLARLTNTNGTAHVVELAEEWPHVERLLYVSTAYVAGRRTGLVLEDDNGTEAGWINGYEQSKYEAEALVRSSRVPWVIARSATIVCDGVGQAVRQLNAVHYTLRLWRDGLVPLMPGAASTPTDVVALDFVADAIVSLAFHPAAARTTSHLCAGASAMAAGDIMALAWDVWRADPEWRRRSVPRPAFVNLATYSLYESTVLETADDRLQHIVRSLASYAPQLAYPKCFDTRRAEALFGGAAVSAEALWRTVLAELLPAQRAGAAA